MIASNVLFETSRLSRRFHPARAVETLALVNVSLTVAAGDVLVLTGPSGSGKTTLLSLLGMLDRPTSGQLLFQGRDLAQSPDIVLAHARRRLGYVFQDSCLLPRLSLLDNIGYPLIPRGIGRRHRNAIAERWLTRLGIAHHAHKRPAELSTGERQRVALARALAGDPLAVLADEPTANLDPKTGGDVCDLFREINAAGVTLIVATHDPALAAIATHSLHLIDGKIANEAPTP
jgi:putative ABC transport system ATP-binding protein